MVSEIQEIIDELAFFSRDNNKVEGMVLFGSVSRGTERETSDVDLALVLFDENDGVSVIEDLIKLWGKRLVCECRLSKRVFFYLCMSDDNPNPHCSVRLRKVDFHLTSDLGYLSRNLINTELQMHQFSQFCPVDKTGRLEKEIGYILGPGKAEQIEDDYFFEHHVLRFIELFDLCARNASSGDLYRAQYFLFLARHHLVVMEVMMLGERSFLYLPKTICERYPAGCVSSLPVSFELDIPVESSVEPILRKYFQYFMNLVQASTCQDNDNVSFTFLDVDTVKQLLQRILDASFKQVM
eukprot:TRINITY_DN2255_c0_g2_i1.p1 TRINITY_DN2255_c0_g2~~TRINITY_DN2255_c0_g2_i1.p1  ORF type:complete len:296 (-),score=8.23 TRINITY_DN2255_c0_g2_i1:34-921(-)